MKYILTDIVPRPHHDDDENFTVQPPSFSRNESNSNSEQFSGSNNDQNSHSTTAVTVQVKNQNTPHCTAADLFDVSWHLNKGVKINKPIYAPDTHLTYAIFTCLCCCWPLGLAAIITSIRCSLAVENGNIDKARRLSARTKCLAHFSTIFGFTLAIMYLIYIYSIYFSYYKNRAMYIG